MKVVFEEVKINGNWYSYSDLVLDDFIDDFTYGWTDDQKINYLKNNSFNGYVEDWDLDEQLKETIFDEIYDGLYDDKLRKYFSDMLDPDSRDSYSNLGLSQRDFF